MKKLDIVVFGLSITSSWGNGHATTFRSLIRALSERGHRVTFFEKDAPWYAPHRDLPSPTFCQLVLYRTLEELSAYESAIRSADLAILGSYVSDSRELAIRIRSLCSGCFAFYDIDTPVTMAKLEREDFEYLHPAMIPDFDLYLSFTGGRLLDRIESDYQAQRARALYCSVDPELYFPEPELQEAVRQEYLLAYLGTYSEDRQPTVNRLLIESAVRNPDRRFCVAGAKYPGSIKWPANVERMEHVPPDQHRFFYNAQRFTLNVTRQDMIAAGYSPSVRLFEAGACATAVISDCWEGIETLFVPGEEILLARDRNDVQDYLDMPEQQCRRIGERMRSKVMSAHTAAHRARELEQYWLEAAALSSSAQTSSA